MGGRAITLTRYGDVIHNGDDNGGDIGRRRTSSWLCGGYVLAFLGALGFQFSFASLRTDHLIASVRPVSSVGASRTANFYSSLRSRRCWFAWGTFMFGLIYFSVPP